MAAAGYRDGKWPLANGRSQGGATVWRRSEVSPALACRRRKAQAICQWPFVADRLPSRLARGRHFNYHTRDRCEQMRKTGRLRLVTATQN